MEITGKVKLVGQEVQISNTYAKRELVVSTEEQYPQHILINFTQGKCNDKLDKLTIGQEVKVGINLRGREWVNPQGETKYFNEIQGWKIE
jgi:translation initiation factor IF-3